MYVHVNIAVAEECSATIYNVICNQEQVPLSAPKYKQLQQHLAIRSLIMFMKIPQNFMNKHVAFMLHVDHKHHSCQAKVQQKLSQQKLAQQKLSHINVTELNSKVCYTGIVAL
jgi:hypothetical protein